MSDHRNSNPSIRDAASQWLRFGMEGIVLLIVALTPWVYGAVDPLFEYAIFAGIALILALWGVRSIVDGSFFWYSCPIAVWLAVIFSIGVIQLVPMPRAFLSLVSPAAARLNEDFRPQQPEVISPGDPPASHTPPAAISVSPEATRVELYRWLALLLLYAAVRANLACTASLKRLSWVALANGFALSIFGMAQFFNSGPRTVYGYLTNGEVFGPFICRNHFSYYINICIGLCIGLLLIASRSDNDKRARRTHKINAMVEQSAEDETTISFLSILHSPMQVWLAVGISIMLCAIVCSLSRGGVASIVIGCLVAICLRGFSNRKRVQRLELLVIPALLVVGLIAWLGISPLESRLASLWRGGIFGDGRVQIWSNLLPLTSNFALFGSGYGTLQFVEPLNRQFDYQGYSPGVFIDHAHNDYLQSLIEGGVLKLAGALALVYFAFRFGRKAMKRHETRTPGRLAFGAMIGVAAVAAHSFVDFGLNTPAVAVLVVVVAAQLASMSRSDPTEPPTNQSHHSIAFSNAGGWVAAGVLIVLGGILARQGAVMNAVADQRIAAFSAKKDVNYAQAIVHLTKAVGLVPADPVQRMDLGQLFFDARRYQIRRFQERAQFSAAALLMGNSMNLAPGIGNMALLSAVGEPGPHVQREFFDQYTKPALEQMIAARDLCPLLAKPQARLAAYAVGSNPEGGITMAQSDPPDLYWIRALSLAPYDADLLYYSGKIAFKNGLFDQAWSSWRKSLERHPTHIRAIIEAAVPKIGGDGLLQHVLPENNPQVLIEAAQLLASDPSLSQEQRKILERSKQLLTTVLTIDADISHQLAITYRMLGDTDSALSQFRTTLNLAPNRGDWRYEYAELLYSLQTTTSKREAIAQLEEAIRLNPSHTAAQNLRNIISREMPKR